MQFYAGPDEESTFSCLRKHRKITLNDQANSSWTTSAGLSKTIPTTKEWKNNFNRKLTS
ncbi:hypothetical protein SynA1544_02626 [Synechococcus sp. A15-44]|jgi:hypothetical protein|nr:hypothetical protein SynA1544_02626 [Synechococcus sp. A15-44]